MAEIRLTALAHDFGGPDLPTQHHARMIDRSWPGGGTVKVLELNIGIDYIQIWPADSDYIRELGEKLIKIAYELDSRM